MLLSKSRPLLHSSKPSQKFQSFKPAVLRSFHQTRTFAMAPDIKRIATGNAFPVAGPYTQAIATPSLIFVSGQIPGDANGQLVRGSIAVQTAACCENIKAILAQAGSDMAKVVKVNVFLDDMAHFAEMNTTYERYFAHRPARSCVAVKALPLGVPVEIECVALP